ncbi:MAG: Rpn family recombination-promoting nuclease/putative transposase [Deltaproteobacteria bacterium]
MGVHDQLFKRVFRLPANAASELASVLPADLVAGTDLGSLALVHGSFVGTQLDERFTDALFRADFHGVTGYIWLLLEHQSAPDRWMVLRVLEYFARAWLELVRQKPPPRTLPPVVCVIVHHGDTGWTAPRRLHDLVEGLDVAPELRRFVPDFEIIVDDLARQPDEILGARTMPASEGHRLQATGCSPSGSLFGVAAHHPTFALAGGANAFSAGLKPEAWSLKPSAVVMRYIISVAGSRSFDEILKRIVKIAPTLEVPMTSAAEQLIQEGVRRGKAEGEAKGKAESILDVLDARGIAMTADQRARVLVCRDVPQLARWLRAAATASSADDLFAH